MLKHCRKKVVLHNIDITTMCSLTKTVLPHWALSVSLTIIKCNAFNGQCPVKLTERLNVLMRYKLKLEGWWFIQIVNC